MKATTGVQDYIRRNRTPATIVLIGSFLAIFVLSWMMNGSLSEPLQFKTEFSQPWGLLTYPWASTGNGMGLLWFLLEMYWLFWVGGATEQDLGTKKYLAVFFGSAVAAALFLWLGLALVYPGQSLPIVQGPGLAISALTVIWGVRNPTVCIRLMMCIPVAGWILAWLTVALTLFGFGSLYHAPLIGVFAIGHLGLAYLFAANRLPGVTYGRQDVSRAAMKATERRDKSYFEDVRRREQDRAERERLRKMFEDSMNDDAGK
jgi:membrane associated rhomboid family serine protease